MEYFLKVLRVIFFIPFAISVLFLICSAISYSNTNILNGELNEKVANTPLLIKFISHENTLMRLSINEDEMDYLAHTENLLEKFTSIQLKDLKSYIGSEIPWEKTKVRDVQIHPYVSMESSPPLEVLLYERELSIQVLGQMIEVNPSSSVLSSDLISEVTNFGID
ncbi:hypothetical protein [Pseudoneobacillus sp. C159]